MKNLLGKHFRKSTQDEENTKIALFDLFEDYEHLKDYYEQFISSSK